MRASLFLLALVAALAPFVSAAGGDSSMADVEAARRVEWGALGLGALLLAGAWFVASRGRRASSSRSA